MTDLPLDGKMDEAFDEMDDGLESAEGRRGLEEGAVRVVGEAKVFAAAVPSMSGRGGTGTGGGGEGGLELPDKDAKADWRLLPILDEVEPSSGEDSRASTAARSARAFANASSIGSLGPPASFQPTRLSLGLANLGGRSPGLVDLSSPLLLRSRECDWGEGGSRPRKGTGNEVRLSAN